MTGTLSNLILNVINAKLDLSLLGIGISLEKADPISDIETALTKMLEQINKAGKKILILIDEVVGNDFVRPFVSEFQILIRQEFPIFLIMTGLYENLYDLQNDKALTFLYRTPKIYLEPLNFTAMRRSYQNIFDIGSEEAGEMALLTAGYPFAFQVLGYVCWHLNEKLNDEVLDEFDQYMSEYVYEKIWSELSEKDRDVAKNIAKLSGGETSSVKEIRESMQMSANEFSVYRERLKRKGIIDTSKYGKISFVLPRFDVFVHTRSMLEA